MGVKSVSGDFSERQNWDIIFKSLVKILQTKQEQLEALLKDRKIIESSIKSKQENWLSGVRNYENQLSLVKTPLSDSLFPIKLGFLGFRSLLKNFEVDSLIFVLLFR